MNSPEATAVQIQDIFTAHLQYSSAQKAWMGASQNAPARGLTSSPRQPRKPYMPRLVGSPGIASLGLCLGLALLLQLVGMWPSGLRHGIHLLLALGSVNAWGAVPGDEYEARADVDLTWHAPAQTQINNLTAVIGGEGVYGFIYNTSDTPADKYGVYNWCNMPHVRRTEYIKPDKVYELVYVEVIHRHHKRTPYAANSFPVEPVTWPCTDEAIYHHGTPLSGSKRATPAYWAIAPSPLNPFTPPGWRGTCEFPQITGAGLTDSWQHGADLYGVYYNLLGLLPGRDDPAWRRKVVYRVTTNGITSQVAGMVIHGMWRTPEPVALVVQPGAVDSLEPKYPCRVAAELFKGLQAAGNMPWREHLKAAEGLFAELDGISGVPKDDEGFHVSLDHYYDNLSARQCHQMPLPCKIGEDTKCVTQEMADTVYRLGQWEYSHVYRGAGGDALAAAAASYGVWVAELAEHLRAVAKGEGGEVVYFHNIAHDGSVSRLLGVLQADVMVWPGMGSEVVFELYKRRGASPESGHLVRVLFGGRALKSSNPSLGVMDMLPVETLLAYFDGLAGVRASLVVGKCNRSIPAA
ncbi:histidine phosphatase superfamily [Lasiosphaeris hirsuta]|uniref:Histidine phosphatase superfamily n=1 Tax=Lasiosphaeris hirsuta TaxID=260670 RepID=A0AA39ZWE1_9PEZI|nr:histidine phosphatase superfamily [Lasiosphaeris hirsuta]